VGGAVVASLNSGGALVLTSTVPGSTGTVVVGASLIATDLGLSATAVTGTDATAVNIGGGQLQGLIDSRDVLLQERIDGVNALASRVIESVNSLSASGVGLDGIGGRKLLLSGPTPARWPSIRSSPPVAAQTKLPRRGCTPMRPHSPVTRPRPATARTRRYGSARET